MKSIALRTVIGTAVCSVALVSYVVAGAGSGHRHSNSHNSGPGFSADNNPGFLGRMGKDEHNDFFNSANNPGVQGSAFGRSTAQKASANGTLHRNEQATSNLFNNSDWTANAKSRRPNPVPSATPSQGISPIPSATPGGSHPPSPPPIPSPIPSATPGGTHSSPSPIPSATPGGTHWSPSPIPSATPGGSHPPVNPPGISPIPSATPGGH
jgi:hypothetical protein